ncbi:hypothetical protein BDB13_5772 [Rhodococcus sp. OK302]|nr:hypothetical protein BDB13_5772 [Rhodococcus sp. OK302]
MVIFFDALFALSIAMITWFGGYVVYRLVSDESGRR